MKQYSYSELIECCEQDSVLVELLELMIETALSTVLTGVRGAEQNGNLRELSAVIEQINNHLRGTEFQSCFVAPEIVQDHEALACWAGELVFSLYRQRKL